MTHSQSQPPAERCYWVRDGLFLAGAYPLLPSPDGRLSELVRAGIRTFINLVEAGESNVHGEPYPEYSQPLTSLASELGEELNHVRRPIRDLGIPTFDGMREILDTINNSIQLEQPVYLHCLGGIGRTGTVVCCWLLDQGVVTGSEVIEYLRELRLQDRQTCGRRAPQSSVQHDFVSDWAAKFNP